LDEPGPKTSKQVSNFSGSKSGPINSYTQTYIQNEEIINLSSILES
jgi:hypothetical protein